MLCGQLDNFEQRFYWCYLRFVILTLTLVHTETPTLRDRRQMFPLPMDLHLISRLG